MNEKEVPQNAVGFVDSMNLTSKIRWYKEFGYEKISYEAKTTFNRKRLSIEFSENGTFQDFEIEIKLESILPDIYKNITDYLLKAHGDYSIQKVQKQYSGASTLILNYFLNPESAKGLIINYEVVISTKENGVFVMFEYLFDENGVFIQMSQIKTGMNDNIVY